MRILSLHPVLTVTTTGLFNVHYDDVSTTVPVGGWQKQNLAVQSVIALWAITTIQNGELILATLQTHTRCVAAQTTGMHRSAMATFLRSTSGTKLLYYTALHSHCSATVFPFGALCRCGCAGVPVPGGCAGVAMLAWLCRWGSYQSSGRASQSSHTRTAPSQPREGTGRRAVEQPLQTHLPQLRQW